MYSKSAVLLSKLSSFPLLQCCTSAAQRVHENCGTLHTKDVRSEDATCKSEPGYQSCCCPWLQNDYGPTSMKRKIRPTYLSHWLRCLSVWTVTVLVEANMKLWKYVNIYFYLFIYLLQCFSNNTHCTDNVSMANIWKISFRYSIRYTILYIFGIVY